jgi:hypothetical protein
VKATTVEYAHLETLARQFGELVPDHIFSPADLQDFLLTRRKDPQRAIDELEEWKVTTVEERAKKAEDEAKRRKARAEKTKRKMIEMMAMSEEMQGAIRVPGAFHNGGSATVKEGVKDASEGANAKQASEREDGQSEQISEERTVTTSMGEAA